MEAGVVLWLSLAAIAVALCLWRRHPAVARVVGCSSEDDTQACLDYLNGSLLLPAAVALVVLLGFVAAVSAWLASFLLQDEDGPTRDRTGIA